MKKVFIFLILLTTGSWIQAQDKTDPLDLVIKAIREADANSLAGYFNMTIELKLPDNENTYSASQGEMIMKDFFKKSPPDSCTIIQKGNTDNKSMFAICNYLSGNLQFQVFLYGRLQHLPL